MAGFESVYDTLDKQALVKATHGDGRVEALCPAHADSRASLSVKEGDDGRALVYCHAGCNTLDVIESLGLKMSDLFTTGQGSVVVDTYTYVDEDGAPLTRVTRLEPKGFYQERWEDGRWQSGLGDTRRVLYRLPEVLAAVAADETIYFVEGEKDADNLAAVGVVATTVLGGAGKWTEAYGHGLGGARVVLIPDQDDPGRLGSERVAAGLRQANADVEVRLPVCGKDVTDHLLAGYTLDALLVGDNGLGEFVPIDWETYTVEGTAWLYEPYIPRTGRVLAFGPAGSLKSLWAMWVGAHLAQEGKRVAYFSLEMLPSDAVRRLRQLAPPKDNFTLFTHLELGDSYHTERMIAGLKGHDLIIVDSWTAAVKRYVSNEEVARLDSETLLPIIKATGAAILILDNTGHDWVANDGSAVKANHARGASAKADKMEITLWFRNPSLTNNYRTKIEWRKMRLDYPMPSPVTIETPRDRIEMYRVDAGDVMTRESMWPTPAVKVPDSGRSNPESPSPADADRALRQTARLRGQFKAIQP